MEQITLKEALAIINECKQSNRKRCSIEYVSYDKRRKGSRLKKVINAYRGSSSHDEMKNHTVNVATNGRWEARTIHIPLIMKVNGKKVLL